MTVDGRHDVFTEPHGAPLAPVATFSPLLARTQIALTPVEPIAFDCLKFIIVRSGRARLFSEFGAHFVGIGDVIILAANTLCGAEPEGSITTTALYLDRDYVVDQVFWQYAFRFHERLDASRFLDTHYVEPTQVLRIGKHRTGLMMPLLDELVALSVEGVHPDRFYRAQSLVSALFDVLLPFIVVAEERTAGARRNSAAPSVPRHRLFRPVRPEILDAAHILRTELDRQWTVTELAARAHLSVSQLRRVFIEAFGKSPISYLMMLRAEKNGPPTSCGERDHLGDRSPGGMGRCRLRCAPVPSEHRRTSERVPQNQQGCVYTSQP